MPAPNLTCLLLLDAPHFHSIANGASYKVLDRVRSVVKTHSVLNFYARAITGPRTMERLESRLPAAGVVLDAATLDRIDEIIKPGGDRNPRGHGLRRARVTPSA